MQSSLRVLQRRVLGIALASSALLFAACGGGGGGSGGGSGDGVPTGVLVQASAHRIDVSWQPVDGASAYNVYVAADPGVAPDTYPYLPEGRHAPAVRDLTMRFDGLLDGGTYWAVVTAVSGGQEGAPSAPAKDVLPVGGVQNLATWSDIGSVRVTWYSTRGAESYDVVYAASPEVTHDNYATLPEGRMLSAPVNQVSVDGLKNGTTYWFAVRARNYHGPGSPSARMPGRPNGLGSFDVVTAFESGAGATGTAVGDLDGDLDLDLVVANREDANVMVFENGDGAREPFLLVETFDVPGDRPMGVALADADRDGLLDLYVLLEDAGAVVVHRGDGHGSFAAETYWVIPVGKGPADLVVRDVNGDEWPDVVTADRVGGSVSLALGQDPARYWIPVYEIEDVYEWVDVFDEYGNYLGQEWQKVGEQQVLTDWIPVDPDPFHPTTTIYQGFGPLSLVVDDLDGNGTQDVAVVEADVSRLGLLQGDGLGGFSVRDQIETGTSAVDVATADTDGDGDPDLVVTCDDDQFLIVLGNLGQGQFVTAGTYPHVVLPVETASGDFDADGVLDLVVADLGDGEVTVFLGTGSGGFAQHFAMKPCASVAHMEVGDFDGDHFLDVLVTDPEAGCVLILYGATE